MFGSPPCNNPGNTTIAPAGIMVLHPKNDTNPCGYPFGISFRWGGCDVLYHPQGVLRGCVIVMVNVLYWLERTQAGWPILD